MISVISNYDVKGGKTNETVLETLDFFSIELIAA